MLRATGPANTRCSKSGRSASSSYWIAKVARVLRRCEQLTASLRAPASTGRLADSGIVPTGEPNQAASLRHDGPKIRTGDPPREAAASADEDEILVLGGHGDGLRFR